LKFSTKTRYGLRAILEIAKNNDQNGVFQKEIAEKQAISNKYLDHIIASLKASGLIRNVKGKKSGYVLTRKPEEISVLDVHNAFEHGICVIECMDSNFTCERKIHCDTFPFWTKLNLVVLEFFKGTTLNDLLKEEQAENRLFDL
jgi:Rrf2 family protein